MTWLEGYLTWLSYAMVTAVSGIIVAIAVAMALHWVESKEERWQDRTDIRG